MAAIAPVPAPGPDATTHPTLTVPQILSFVAFGIFVAAAIVASNSTTAFVTAAELSELRKLTLFLIAAMLPSDALIRFGRNLLFQTVDDPNAAAQYTPATTLAQLLAFATFVVVVVMTVISQKLVSTNEFSQINDVARVLIIALLPSDAAIRFGRALYYRAPSTPTATPAQLKRV